MALIKVGRYVINPEYIVYVDLEFSKDEVVIYLERFAGKVITANLGSKKEWSELETESLKFTGNDAKGLREHFHNSLIDTPYAKLNPLALRLGVKFYCPMPHKAGCRL